MRPFPPGNGGLQQQFIARGHDSAAVYLAIVLHFLAILVVTAAAVYIVVRIVQARGTRRGSGSRSPGLDELDLRYARGEIDRTEYVTRRADLLGITYGPPPAYPQVGGQPPASG